MPSPREYYKSRHPKFFSDSLVEETSDVDRSLLEYHLHSLTSRSQEADFERFARRLCERMICPNLLPTTGPTGGGDSKADSETYPVADRLTLQWYEGIGREAGQERWAFAFSAKADWLPKVKSDVKKIVETSRGYTKAFFVTNQSISAKKRAEVEDDLQKKHNIHVNILDRTWVLEKVFTGRAQDLAITELKVTAISNSSVRLGKGDAAQTERLAAAEARIAAALQSSRLGSELADDALEAADACRSLERPRGEIEACYKRADTLALQYGTLRQQVEAAYQLAWTWCWWFEDNQSLIPQYSIVEERAKNSENVYDLERLLNLWMILSRVAHSNQVDSEGPEWLKPHTAVLRKELERLAYDTTRPSVSLQARTHLLQIELSERARAGDELSGVLTGFQEIIKGSEGLVGFPFEPLAEILTLLGEAVEDTPAFNLLLETVVETAAKRSGEVRAASILLRRGEQLMEQERPARAIALVGQALVRLYKHETRHEIVYALFLCGRAYERVGLLWAARATYLFGASIAVNDFWTYGDLKPGFAVCVDALKRIELRLGRLPQLLAWHELDRVIWERLTTGLNTPASEESEVGFDTFLSHMVIRMPPEHYAALGGLPDTLDRLQLYSAASVLLFLLGHTERMSEIADDAQGSAAEAPERAADELADLAWQLKADVPVPKALQLYESGQVTLSAKVLGCQVTASCSLAFPCVEVAEWILAAFESFLATSIIAGVFAYEPSVTMEVVLDEKATEVISFEQEDKLGRVHFVVRCRPCDPYQDASNSQAEMEEQLASIIFTLFACMVRFRDMEASLEKLFRDERVLDRAVAFTRTIGAVCNVLGKVPKFRLGQWIHPSAVVYPMTRTQPWTPSVPASEPETTQRPTPMFSTDKEVPEGLFNLDKLSHDQLEIISHIRLPLWDRAMWSGCLYMWDRFSEAPPLLGLMFGGDKEAAVGIFSSWRSDFGSIDEARELRIAIVRGIDRAHPYAYRVLIGANLQSSEDSVRIYMMMSRIHQMDAVTPDNLDGFLKQYEKHKRFILVPAFVENGEPVPVVDAGIGMYEVVVRSAWEIGMNDPDIGGVSINDDLIIPDGITDPPVKALLEWKRTKNL